MRHPFPKQTHLLALSIDALAEILAAVIGAAVAILRMLG